MRIEARERLARVRFWKSPFADDTILARVKRTAMKNGVKLIAPCRQVEIDQEEENRRKWRSETTRAVEDRRKEDDYRGRFLNLQKENDR
jgi:hypothetical protein